MNQQIKNKLWNELSPKERIKLNFKENSMLYKFYLWLIELKGGQNGSSKSSNNNK